MKQLLMVMVVGLSLVSQAATWYVSAATGSDTNSGTSSSEPRLTIQSAIDVAADGDTILVYPGTYDPISTTNAALHIVGVEGRDVTIIDGKGTMRCADLGSSAGETNTLLKGFSILQGHTDAQPGAGVRCGQLQDCYVAGCTNSFGIWNSEGGGAWGTYATDCVLENNYATHGAGMAWGWATRCVIRNNYAADDGGGLRYCTCYDCLIVSNRSNNSGGKQSGSAIDGGTYYNCTVVGNEARSGGTFNSGTLYNCIVYGNTPVNVNDSSVGGDGPVVLYSCETNNPGFVDMGNGDYHLTVGSPCINAGDNAYVANDNDLDGNDRIVDGVVDIGCYEYYAHVAMVIKKVEAGQLYPWDGQVEIVVTIQGDTNRIAQTECTFAATNNATQSSVKVATISQVGGDVFANDVCTRRYLWNAAIDVGEANIADLMLIVGMKEMGGVQLWENGPYWAECNVGASEPEEYGYYFWWGDTVGYAREGGTWTADWYYNGVSWSSSTGTRMSESPFTSSACPTCDKDNSALESLGYIDSSGNLEANHDAATVHLGVPWRMPTAVDIDALVANCTNVWTMRNGVYGRLVTGKGDYASRSIFLPAAGYGFDSNLTYPNLGGGYWSSTLYSDDSHYAWYLHIHSRNLLKDHNNGRHFGQPVRPLRDAVQRDLGSSVATYLSVDCRAYVAIRLDANGGTCTETSTNIVSGAAVGELPVPVLDGYAFVGWYTAVEDGNRVTDDTTFSVDTALYAHWTYIPKQNENIVVTPSVADGTRFVDEQTVELTADGGETVWYTLDDSDPMNSETRQKYAGAIRLTDTTTIKYYAVNAYGDWSAVQTAQYIRRMADGGPYWENGWKFTINEGESMVIGASNLVGEVVMPEELGKCPVTGIARSAFEREVELTSFTIPDTVTNIGYFAFRDCLRLAEVKFLGARPHVDLGAFMGVPAYAVVSSKTGCVTAVLPTEVNGDVVSVPEGWLDEIATRHKGDTPAGYSSYEEAFVAKYGSDLAKALAKPTGKRDTQGNAMMVWQDFVAGTDPLDEEDAFRATVTLEDGVPVVRWLPELTAAEAAKRSYKTYAKTALKDGAEWTDVTSLTDEARQEAGYQFFKVTVEMK